MQAEAKRKLQIVMLIAFLIAEARTLWIFHGLSPVVHTGETGAQKTQ